MTSIVANPSTHGARICNPQPSATHGARICNPQPPGARPAQSHSGGAWLTAPLRVENPRAHCAGARICNPQPPIALGELIPNQQPPAVAHNVELPPLH
jgi:hypothetical protein